MSSRVSNLRLVLAIALFTSVVFAPSWLAAIFAFALAARWRAWEVIAAGMLMDFLWMPSWVSFLAFNGLPLATMISIAVVFCLEPLRRQLLIGPALLE